jgi:hypothetical protein
MVGTTVEICIRTMSKFKICPGIVSKMIKGSLLKDRLKLSPLFKKEG